MAAVDGVVRALLDDMLDTLYAANGRGLAAVQIGELRRLVVIDLGWKDGRAAPLFLVNPEVVWRSDDAAVAEERCLSIPDSPVVVARRASVRVRFVDRDGAPREVLANGMLARAIQHEVDHLDGVLILDRIDGSIT